MHKNHYSAVGLFRQVLCCGSALALVGFAPAAFAQTEGEGPSYRSGTSEIIVTARKRDETAIDVPAAITALGSEALEKYGTRDFWGLQNQVPGLYIQDIPSSSGGAIALRGMGSSPNNPANDQTVAINVDGVQVGSGSIMRIGQFDLAQVEVLKGPQALFFGKNSPAGVISIRSADPGDSFEVKGSLDYEFNAREAAAQVALGGPITDTLGARLAVAGSKMKGWMKNNAQVFPGFTYAPSTTRGPDKEEFLIRGTVVFKPSDRVNFRAKYNYSSLKSDTDLFTRQQRIMCPYGAPQNNGYPGTIDCKADDITTNGGQDPRLIAAITPLIPQDRKYRKFLDVGQDVKQHLASLEGNFEIVPDISLTAVSGYYKIKDHFSGAAMYQGGAGLTTSVPSDRREISQEIRLVSNKTEWPVNFAIGGYFQDTKITNSISNAIDLFALGFAPGPGVAFLPSSQEFQTDGKAISFFGQLIITPVEKIEIAAGARWTKEKKSVKAWDFGAPKLYDVNDLKFTNTSPEVTIRYRPTPDWTIFGAWRNGFKSGGFNTASGQASATVTAIDYRPEDVMGFEAGVKYQSGPLRASITAYTYKYKDLQVAIFDPVAIAQRLVNAASARIKGIEGDFSWMTPLDGFELRGSFNYNKARYIDFIAACYTGQMISEGCNLVPNPLNGRFTSQELSGRPLVLAPDWTGSLGFSYVTPVSSSLEFGISSDVLYSSSFYGQLELAPQGKQRQYANVDATVHVGAEDGRWKLSLIGRNLTQVYRSRFVSQTPLTGISTRTGTNIPGGLPDLSGNVNRGREIRMQFSFRY